MNDTDLSILQGALLIPYVLKINKWIIFVVPEHSGTTARIKYWSSV